MTHAHIAGELRALIAKEFSKVFGEVDCLAWPTAPTPAFELGSHASDPVSMYLEDVFTVPVNLAGLPAISIPISTARNSLPMGLQIIGRQFGDPHVFRIAKAIEDRVGKLGLDL